jgi:hypothetical protein
MWNIEIKKDKKIKGINFIIKYSKHKEIGQVKR